MENTRCPHVAKNSHPAVDHVVDVAHNSAVHSPPASLENSNYKKGGKHQGYERSEGGVEGN